MPNRQFLLPISSASGGSGGGGGGTSTVNAQTGTTYTAAIGDANNIVTMTNAGASVFNIPTNANVAFAVGTIIVVIQNGAGQVTLTALSGVTVLSASSLTTRAQYSVVTVEQISANTWIAAGDLT
jgi:hypothetical protein